MPEDKLTVADVDEITKGINHDIQAKDVEGLGLTAQLLLSRLIDSEKRLEKEREILFKYDLKNKKGV